jgi:hypothetical protein
MILSRGALQKRQGRCWCRPAYPPAVRFALRIHPLTSECARADLRYIDVFTDSLDLIAGGACESTRRRKDASELPPDRGDTKKILLSLTLPACSHRHGNTLSETANYCLALQFDL